jgi:Phosphomannomutase
MAVYDFKELQNGSDIRGIALETGSGEKPDLTERSTDRIGKGFLLWLSRKTGKAPGELRISIGRDPRLSGPDLQRWLTNSLVPYGVCLLDCGLATTPAMFMSTVFPEFACDGAVMITASHLPYERNGFKFFTRGGGLEKTDIARIIEYAESDTQLAGLGQTTNDMGYVITGGHIVYPAHSADLMTAYSAHLRKLITMSLGFSGGEKPLEGLKIVVDAGNGSGGFYARDVLEPLGADIGSSQFLDPDGNFPNHIPNPENQEAMDSIRLAVTANGADLGLIFDTDVDRSSAVASDGREISRNAIVALAAAITAKDAPGTTVVTDSVTSDHLTDFIEGLGLKHLRFKRGYRNVIGKAIELENEGTDSALAIETSGHCAMRDNYFMDDGAYLAARIVIEEARMHRDGKSVSDMIADLVEPAEAVEYRMPIDCGDFREYAQKILDDIRAWANEQKDMTVVEPNYEGVRVSYDDGKVKGWFLIRMSLHEPLMPMNVESDSASGCEAMMLKIKPFLNRYDHLSLA